MLPYSHLVSFIPEDHLYIKTIFMSLDIKNGQFLGVLFTDNLPENFNAHTSFQKAFYTHKEFLRISVHKIPSRGLLYIKDHIKPFYTQKILYKSPS